MITKDELCERIKSNDNRLTALPYLLLLQEKRTYVGSEDHGHKGQIKFVEHNTGDYIVRETRADLIKEMKENGYEESELNIERFWEGYYWETINVFFTDKGYEDHMNLNKHNIGEHRTYGIHAFRNPEMNCVSKLLSGEYNDKSQ